MLVRDVLKAKGGRVISIGEDASVAEAIARLVQNNIGSLPVVDPSGKLVGVISERDVLRGTHSRGEAFGRERLRDVMTKSPATCSPEDDVDVVMGHMSEKRIAKVPVLDGGGLVGVISVGDMIKVMYERVHAEKEHLMSYIYGQA